MDAIDWLSIRTSTYDGKPIKNKLPDDLKNRFYTEKQWIDQGKQLKENARFVEMHPNAMNKKLCKYYSDEEVIPLPADVEICANCIWRYSARGMCPVVGAFVSGTGHCSEWESKARET